MSSFLRTVRKIRDVDCMLTVCWLYVDCMLTVRRYGRSSDLSGDVVRFIRFGSDYLVWLCWFRFQFGWFRPSSGKLKDVHSRIKIFAIISGSGPSLNMNTAMGDGANRYRSICPSRFLCVLLPVLRRASCEWLCLTEALRRFPQATRPNLCKGGG